jgi:hypothetical protein
MLVSNTGWSWENDQVQKALSNYRRISASTIKSSLNEHHNKIIVFYKKTYQELLK